MNATRHLATLLALLTVLATTAANAEILEVRQVVSGMA